MKIIFATCDTKPMGTDDDQLLVDCLLKQGHEVQSRSWTSTSVRWGEADHVVIRSTWDYTPKLKQFLKWAKSVATSTNLINSYEVLDWNSSKHYLLELEKRGLSTIPSFFSSDFDECLNAVERLLKNHNKIVLKPAVSASAALTYRITSTDGAGALIKSILKQGDVLIQPFVESVAKDGEVSLIYFRNKTGFNFSHAVLKVPAQGDFRVQLNFGGSVNAFMPDEHLKTFGLKALEKLPGRALYARVDIVDWNTKPKIGELELVEPELFFRFASGSPQNFAAAFASQTENVSK